MNTLIKKVLEYQQTNDEFLYEDIINELDKLINIQCSKIVRYYKEDLKQELLLEIYKGISYYKPEKELIKDNLECKKINIILKNIIKSKYYKSFKKKYGFKDNILNLKDVKLMTNVINEFYLFCNENQFRKYINVICERRRIDFCRKYKSGKNLKNISLNVVADDGEELIYKLIDKTSEIKNYEIDYSLLSNKDVKFLKFFFDGNRKLTEKEVAKKIGVTQQAVSSMLKRIRERYRKKLKRLN